MEVEKITCAVEKTDPINKAKMGSQHIRLVEMGLEVAHTITTHEGNVYVQHSNMVVEIKRLTGVTDEKTILRAEQSRAEQSSLIAA